eukprot:366448-Chlamydomonas_euryale.AAC.12
MVTALDHLSNVLPHLIRISQVWGHSRVRMHVHVGRGTPLAVGHAPTQGVGMLGCSPQHRPRPFGLPSAHTRTTSLTHTLVRPLVRTCPTPLTHISYTLCPTPLIPLCLHLPHLSAPHHSHPAPPARGRRRCYGRARLQALSIELERFEADAASDTRRDMAAAVALEIALVEGQLQAHVDRLHDAYARNVRGGVEVWGRVGGTLQGQFPATGGARLVWSLGAGSVWSLGAGLVWSLGAELVWRLGAGLWAARARRAVPRPQSFACWPDRSPPHVRVSHDCTFPYA